MEAQKSLSEDVGLWLWVGFALILTVAYAGWWYAFSGQEGNSPAWVFEGVEETALREISLQTDEEVQWSIRRTETGWRLQSPDVDGSTSSMNRLVDKLLTLQPDRRFESHASETYGVKSDSPYLRVRTTSDSHDLQFGSQTPDRRGRYLLYGSPPKEVFTVQQQDYDALRPSLLELRDQTLFDRSVEDVSSVELRAGVSTTTYHRDGPRWGVEGEMLNDTRSQHVKDAVQSLLRLTADQFHDDHPERLGDDRAQVTVNWGGNESRTVDIGRGVDGSRFVRVSSGPVVEVSQDPVRLFNDLPRIPDGWPEPIAPEAPSTGSPGGGEQSLSMPANPGG